MPALTALYNLLSADTTLTDNLATYNNGEVDEVPAIFVGVDFPDDAKYPAICIKQIDSNSDGTDRGHRGGKVSIDISLWSNKIPSNKPLRDTAIILWKLVDRAGLESSVDFEMPLCICELPRAIHDPDGFQGYVINTTVLIREIGE